MKKVSKKVLSMVLALVMVVSVIGVSALATNSYDALSISEGEPVTITWSGNTGTVTSVDGSGYIPQYFLLWARNEYTIKVDGTTLSAAGVGDDDSAYNIAIDETNDITITAVQNGSVVYTVTCPHYTASTAAGSFPVDVNGYLPVGQFARYNSFGWGNLYSDNSNVKTSSNTTKFLNGYVSTGVSLGMAGGYIQFDMGNNRITNDATNPYGIDFVVYGNAFNGNPEAAGVMVSNDGETWYTLAGSRHYMDGTQWNVDVSYVRLAKANTSLNSAFTKAGIYCSTNFVAPETDSASAVNAAISAATWSGIPQLTGNTYPKPLSTATPASAAWWPEWTNDSAGHAENYGNVWNIADSNNETHVGGVSWLRNGAAEVITYKGITLVEDDMVVLNGNAAPSQAAMTDVYQWGYADVRQNGSSYGTAINPYASTASAVSGGDGFDLAWAVNEKGEPVAISSVRYVRVYSAVLFSAGAFGETSAEVCGVYKVTNDGDGANNGTVELYYGSATTPTTMNSNSVTNVTHGTYYLCSNDANVYINGVRVTDANTLDGHEITVSAGQYIQIISQNGTRSPFITVLKGE